MQEAQSRLAVNQSSPDFVSSNLTQGTNHPWLTPLERTALSGTASKKWITRRLNSWYNVTTWPSLVWLTDEVSYASMAEFESLGCHQMLTGIKTPECDLGTFCFERKASVARILEASSKPCGDGLTKS